MIIFCLIKFLVLKIFFKNNNLDVVFDIPSILANNEFTPLKLKKNIIKKYGPQLFQLVE